MHKSPTEADLQRIRQVTDAGLAIAEFLSQAGANNEVVDALRHGLLAAAKRRSRRAVEMAWHDLLEWFNGLSASDKDVVARLVEQKSGLNLQSEAGSLDDRVRKIIRRGEVRTAVEYRLLQSYLSATDNSARDPETTRKVERLLTGWSPRS